jgi:hypothetical protein
MSNNNNTDTPNSSEDFGGPTASSLKQLAGQLAQWRGMLPRDLQWTEDDPAGFPSPQPVMGGFNQPLDPNLSPHQEHSNPPLFTTDLDSEPVQYPYVYDIQVALLRTRYYYAKYMVYRPFVYKALHFPEQMTQDDAEGVAECLRVCCCTTSCLLSHIFHILKAHLVMSKVAARAFPNIPSQKTGTLSLLLVSKLPWYSPHLPHDTSQPHVTRHTSRALRA